MSSDLNAIGEAIDRVVAQTSRRNLRGVDLAKVVLTAIRQPTPVMESAFYSACDEHGHVLWRYGHRAMVDALLKTGEPADA